MKDMETEVNTSAKRKIHYGHAVKRLRTDRMLSQKEFGEKIGMSQQALCRYEDQEKIEDPVLERLAKGLGVSVEFIKELEEDKPLIEYIQNNTITDNTIENTNGTTLASNNNEGNTYNYTDDKEALHVVLGQLQKLYETNMQLYNQYFKSSQEKFDKLEKELSELKNKRGGEK